MLKGMARALWVPACAGTTCCCMRHRRERGAISDNRPDTRSQHKLGLLLKSTMRASRRKNDDQNNYVIGLGRILNVAGTGSPLATYHTIAHRAACRFSSTESAMIIRSIAALIRCAV